MTGGRRAAVIAVLGAMLLVTSRPAAAQEEGRHPVSSKDAARHPVSSRDASRHPVSSMDAARHRVSSEDAARHRVSSSSSSQAPPGVLRPAQPPIGLRVYAFVEATEMRAAETFRATLGTASMEGVGGGLEVLRLWNGVFARLTYATARHTGERVVVFQSEAIPLGIPMTVELTPFEAGTGWRTDFGRSPIVGAYGGASLVRMRFRQTSDFANRNEDFDETFNGYGVFAGVDVTIGGWVMVGAEAQYRMVPDGLGQSGVSQAFGETDLGGTAIRVMVGIRR